MREDNERNEEGGRDRMGGGGKDLDPKARVDLACYHDV